MDKFANESFCCAYWDWLRGLRPDEPQGLDYGLDWWAAEASKRQCHIEFEKQQLDKLGIKVQSQWSPQI